MKFTDLNLPFLLLYFLLTILLFSSCSFGGSKTSAVTASDAAVEAVLPEEDLPEEASLDEANENTENSNKGPGSSSAAAVIYPQGKDVKPEDKIKITFKDEMNFSTIPAIQVTQNGAEEMVVNGKYSKIEGQWKELNSKSFEFTPAKSFEPGSLIVVTVPEQVKSMSGYSFKSDKSRFSFLVDDGIHNGYQNIFIKTMKTENNGTHNIPMNISVPKKGGPFPVMFWVHGGGWNGGTVSESAAEVGNQDQYLADHLGIAVIGVSYRCKGSNGSFDQAMKDVMDAVDYCRSNSKTYNFDMSRIGFYGGSAGTPLASLTAQKLTEAKVYIGYNGMYDFINTGKGNWGKDNQKYVSDQKASSTVLNLRNPPPATLLLHGTKDTTIDYDQSVRFANAVTKAGGVAEVRLYKGEVHSFFQPKKPMEIPTLYEVKEFLKKYLF